MAGGIGRVFGFQVNAEGIVGKSLYDYRFAAQGNSQGATRPGISLTVITIVGRRTFLFLLSTGKGNAAQVHSACPIRILDGVAVSGVVGVEACSAFKIVFATPTCECVVTSVSVYQSIISI